MNLELANHSVEDVSLETSGAKTDATQNPSLIDLGHYFHEIYLMGKESPTGWAMLRELEVGSTSPFDITETLVKMGALEKLLIAYPLKFGEPREYVYPDARHAATINQETVRVAVLPEATKSGEEVRLRGYRIVAWAEDEAGDPIRAELYNLTTSVHPAADFLTTDAVVKQLVLSSVPQRHNAIRELKQTITALPQLIKHVASVSAKV